MTTDPLDQPDPLDPSLWTPTRTARLGFLLGQGCDAPRAAADPLVAASVRSVRRRARKLGLAFRDGTLQRLPPPVLDRLDAAAAKRRVSRDGLIRSVLIAAGSDDGLIDNILDDGV